MASGGAAINEPATADTDAVVETTVVGTNVDGKPILRQIVALDSATLAALETINALVAGSVSVDNFPATQPVSGTITANLGTIDGASTEASLAALLGEFRARYDVVTTAKATYTTSGPHTLITPPAGQAVRAVWLFAQAKGALDTGVVLVTFTLGANSYDVELTGSQPFAHGAVWEGTADQALVVNTSSTAAVLVNVDYRTF